MALRKRLSVDHSTGSLIITRTQEMDAILRHCRDLQNEGDGFSPDRSWARHMSIPIALAEHIRETVGIDYTQQDQFMDLLAYLEDRDYSKLATSGVKLGLAPRRIYSIPGVR